MGWTRKLGMAASFLAAKAGFAEPPADDAARKAKIEAMYEGYRKDFPGAGEITAQALSARLAAGEPTVLVDVRTEAERAVSMLPGAIPAEAFRPELAEGKAVVAYCTIGYRSGQWVAEQRERGVEALNLRGSVLSWTHVGGALVDPQGQPTKRLHVYGRLWDLARTDHQPIY